MPVAIVGFIATLGIPGLVTAAGSLTFLGNLLAGAIGIGLSLAASALFGPKPATLKPQDLKNTIAQSVIKRRKHRGRVKSGGAGFALRRSRNGSLYYVVYIGEGPTDGFEEHFIDSRPAELDDDGYITASPFNGKVRIETRLGVVPETHYASIMEVFPEIWGVDHRGDGCISIAMTAKGVSVGSFNTIYPNRYPVLESIRRDGVLYDPRTETSAWSANLILIFLDYLRDADGAGIDWDYFDEADFADGADDADIILPTNGGGTVRKYHGQLSYDLPTEPVDIINRMQTATDSRLYLKGNGKIGLHPGKWAEPTVRIHDGCISSYELSDSSGPLREANEVTLSYTNVLTGYTEGSCDPWRDEDDISISGVRTVPVEAYEIQHHHHGRRVQKLTYCRASARWQGTVVTDLWGIKARGERRILLEIKELGIDFEPFEIEDYSEDDETMSVMMKVRSVGSDMYELSSIEEGTPPTVPISIDDDDLDPPQGVVVLGGQRVVSGGNKVAIITSTWDAYPDRDDLTADAQISVADDEKWQAIQVGENLTSAEIVGLTDGGLYDFRVAWRLPGGARSEWTLIENIQAIADADAPGSPIGLGASVAGLTVTGSVQAANDNTAYIQFKRGTTAQSFAAATDLTGDLRVTANQILNVTDNPGSGTWRYWARSKNGSGIASSAVYHDVVVP